MSSAGAAVVILVVSLALWWRFLYVRSGRRLWHPLWLAFSATALALLLIVAGSMGYTLGRHQRFVDGTPWVDHVIWSQIIVGIVAALVAGVFWRLALRRL